MLCLRFLDSIAPTIDSFISGLFIVDCYHHPRPYPASELVAASPDVDDGSWLDFVSKLGLDAPPSDVVVVYTPLTILKEKFASKDPGNDARRTQDTLLMPSAS